MARRHYKEDLQKTHLFGNLFRFIDDLCAINDHLKSEKKPIKKCILRS